MSEIPMAYYWKGRRVEELTHDELLEAFKGLVRERDSIKQAFEVDQRVRATFAAYNEQHYRGLF